MKKRPFAPAPLLAGIAAAGAAALAVRAFLIEPTSVEVTEHSLPLPNLPPAWEGARMVHLTDLHYGDPRSERLFREMVETVNALEPDLIVISGDFVVCQESEVAPCVEHLARLRAKHGVVAVLGDHDFRYKVRPKQPMPGIVDGILGTGIRLLRNESVELPGGLCIAGVDPLTPKLQRADLARALESGPPPHLLLAHSPDIIHQAENHRVPVVLCGHTHGGQVVVPFFGPPITHTWVDREFASGWSSLNGTRMYTGRGLASHHSVRFLCRPEIAVFTLRSSSLAAVG